MSGLGYAIVGLAAGLTVGAFLMAFRRGGSHGSQDPVGATRLEARLEVQSADLRRLADAVGVRDALAERLHEEVAGARRALHELSLREQERRERDHEAWSVVRRLSTVLAGGPPRAGRGRTSSASTSRSSPRGSWSPTSR